MDLFDIAVASKLAGGGGGGGGGGLDLLATQSLGHIQYSSTSATEIAQTISLNKDAMLPYDYILVCAVAGSIETDHHIATITYANVGGTIGVEKTGISPVSYVMQIKDSGGNIQSSSTSSTGIYTDSISLNFSTGLFTITMKQRYNSNNTKTIDNDYTVYVYGGKIWETISPQ